MTRESEGLCSVRKSAVTTVTPPTPLPSAVVWPYANTWLGPGSGHHRTQQRRRLEVAEIVAALLRLRIVPIGVRFDG